MDQSQSSTGSEALVHVHYLTGRETTLAKIVFWTLQPVLIVAVLAIWFA